MVTDFPKDFGELVKSIITKLRQDNRWLRTEVDAQERRIDRQEAMLEELLKEVKANAKGL